MDDLHPEPDGALQPLTREECLELLASSAVGRVAIALPGAPPLVVPVNYALDGEVIVFRTDPGSKLDALQDHPTSFQVDAIDPLRHTGWSVLVQGFAYETSPVEVDLESWAGGPKAHWVRIFPGAITGRRLTLFRVDLDQRGYR